MHFSKAILVSAIAAVASAQSLAGLPACAQTCALGAISSTGCSLTDFKCICSASAYLDSINKCINTACSAADIAATLAFANQVCLSAGVTLSPPAAATTTAAAPAEVTSTLAPTTVVAPYGTGNATVAQPTGTGAPTTSVLPFSGASSVGVAKVLGVVAGFAGLALAL